jgi:hypothetical protein
VTLSARRVLQNNPQFTIQKFEVWTARGQSSALIKSTWFSLTPH